MSGHPEPDIRLERRLAALLQLGTAAGAGVIAIGWIIATLGEPLVSRSMALPIIRIGIAVFILLPGVRVLWMILFFCRERDYRFGAIAAFVFTVIAIGAVLGVWMAGAIPG